MSQIKQAKYQYDAVESSVKKNYGFGVRHVQVLLVFICFSVAFIMRVNMSVAIVAMTDKTQRNPNVEIFHWDKKTQDIILSSFFWGYTLMQIPSGQLCERYGAKPLLLIAMLVNGIVSLIFPWVVSLQGWPAACACRTIQGLTQSCFIPCINILVSHWIPNHERSRLANFIFTGVPIGTIIGMPLSSVLASTSYGWPSIFYTVAALGIIVGIIWGLCGASSPSHHKSISQEEKYYIEKFLLRGEKKKKMRTPWTSILTSIPCWAILTTQIGCMWGFNTLFVEIPSYLNKALGINIKESGFLSALPYMAMWFGSIILSFVSDYIVNHNICSKTVSRKIFNTIGTWGPAVMLIVLSYLPQGHSYLAVVLLTLAVGMCSGMNMGYMMSHIDNTPNFAGTLSGITNSVSQGITIISPISVGYIVTHEHDLSQWQVVFFVTSSIYFFTNVIYLIFATSKVQPWNEPSDFVDVEKVSKMEANKQVENETMLTEKDNSIKE